MKLTLFNGSPRGKKSNTRLLLEHLGNGFTQTEGNVLQLEYLRGKLSAADALNRFLESDIVILAFPLYTDAMPAMVKQFIEDLAPLCPMAKEKKPAIGFIVQSGFIEAHHSRYVEKYLEKLTRRLGCAHLGTVVKGGVEGIQVKPAYMTRKLFAQFHQLGVILSETETLDQSLIRKLAGKEHLTAFGRFMIKLLTPLGLIDAYWNSQLKKNNAYQRRFDTPYF